MLEPIGDYVVVAPDPQPPLGPLWTPPKQEAGQRAHVLRDGGGQFQAGDYVLVSMLQATQVGDELLVPYAGILAKLT